MIIGVAGPYSSPTEEGRKKNLDALNATAARLLEKGHIPLIGVNAAMPVVEKANVPDPYKAIMDISMAVMDKCEALLIIGHSTGADREMNFILKKGLKVYTTLEDVPDVL
ncbi:MAG: DUF1937 family protein [Flavipsychrobacter sp.]|nr:DUF1937 family protein [Flavipsychrobacter sp.]